ncbi:MAG: hypothetical protein CMP23_09070 [Rickettsiales bacterium]|nr:hypothetical protein [Rickettsiales bacterium]
MPLRPLREHLKESPPFDFALKKVWTVLLRALRAQRRSTGSRPLLSSRAEIERALDSKVTLKPEQAHQLKLQLRRLVRELAERTSDDEELRSCAAQVDQILGDLLPRIVTADVSLKIQGWPEQFPTSAQERLLEHSSEQLQALPARDAAALIHRFNGLSIGGSKLSVGVDLAPNERLPSPPRSSRATPQLRNRKRPWLRHLDQEGRRSLTDRQQAMRHADLLESPTVIDACCGCGGDAIAFALSGKQVYAIEQDPRRIEMARRNARDQGVSICFILGSLQTKLAELMEAHPKAAVFVDPPWREGPRISDYPTWPELLPGGQESAKLLERAPLLMLKLPRSFAIGSLPERHWQFEWGFGHDERRNALLMITCWSLNPSLHPIQAGAI